MFVALCLAAGLAPAADPAPLPDRWLLKHLPADLPPSPDRLYAVTWFDGLLDSRLASRYWAVWIDFRRADRNQPAEAVVTLVGGEAAVPPLALAPGHRAVPLAVHGPLVEFDGRLYTATFRAGKPDRDPERVRDMLHLGSAVELKNRVWYQAGTTPPGGKALVEEWRLEFKDDPRTVAEGTVNVRGHWRPVADPEGESFAAELRFKAEIPKDRTKTRIVTLVPPEGKKPARRLPYLVIGDEHRGGADFIWVDGQDRMSLYPAPAEPRRPPGLVQPPPKKPGQ